MSSWIIAWYVHWLSSGVTGSSRRSRITSWLAPSVRRKSNRPCSRSYASRATSEATRLATSELLCARIAGRRFTLSRNDAMPSTIGSITDDRALGARLAYRSRWSFRGTSSVNTVGSTARKLAYISCTCLTASFSSDSASACRCVSASTEEKNTKNSPYVPARSRSHSKRTLSSVGRTKHTALRCCIFLVSSTWSFSTKNT